MNESLKKFLYTLSTEDHTPVELTDGENELNVMDYDPQALIQDKSELTSVIDNQDEIIRDGETLIEYQAAMESYMETIQNARDNGGLTVQEAKTISTGVSLIARETGLQHLTERLSFENFEGSASAKRHTDYAVEDFKASLKQFAETIWRIVQKLYDVITEGAKKVFNVNNRIILRTRMLQSQIAKMKGMTLVDEETGYLVRDKRYTIDGKFAVDVMNLKAVVAINKQVEQNVIGSLADYVKELTSIVNGITKGEDVEEASDKIDNAIGKFGKFSFAGWKSAGSESAGRVVYTSAPVIGEKCVQVTTITKGIGKGVHVEMIPNPDPRAKNVNDSEVTVLDNKGMLDLLDAVDDLTKQQSYGERTFAPVETELKVFKESIRSLNSRISSMDASPEQIELAKKIHSSALNLNKAIGGSVIGLGNYNCEVAITVLSLVEEMIKRYKQPE